MVWPVLSETCQSKRKFKIFLSRMSAFKHQKAQVCYAANGTIFRRDFACGMIFQYLAATGALACP